MSAIASFLPETVLGNDELAALYAGWTADKIWDKTGIRERRIAATDQTAGDLAEAAARRLFAQAGVDPASIDYLLFCSQAMDYVLPATACGLHQRLGLRPSAGALDFSLGCSGFVYGLSLAKGLIESGQAERVLLLTADTYSKLIHPLDKSVRTLFGDGAAATLVEASESETVAIGPFVFGTDGAGRDALIVPAGGARRPSDAQSAAEEADASGNVRTAEHLYMDGAAILTFALREVPKAVERLLRVAGCGMEALDAVVLHQANGFILERLRRKLAIPIEKFVLHLERCGNTVSSSLPLALEPLLARRGSTGAPSRILLAGFGVGFSWAAALIEI